MKSQTHRVGKFPGQARKNLNRARGRTVRPSGRLALESLEDRRLLAAAFFAGAQPAGSVDVKLVPLADVTAGVQEIVTFGVPFTRGSVTPDQLSQVRVLKNGVEIPASVEELTPWRSIDDPSIDGQSVRVARIQIPYTFSALNPETITVQWGGPARVLSRTTMQDPRIEWHLVTSGTFVASDNVQEPDVLPVLPSAYLAKGMLDTRTDPTSSAVAEARDDPTVMESKSFTGYTEYDYAEKNFFYTIVNQNGGTPIDYKTDPEPWLYDRSAGMYELYMRSGFATALREAIRSTDFYVQHLDPSGFFTLKPGDPKYAYNEALAYTYWLLGDNRMLAPISKVVNAFSGTETHWSLSLSFWTERNVGDKLLATEVAYEVTGNATFKSSVQTIVNDLIWHQNGAGGQLPSNRVDGGLYHTGAQHDITEASSGDVLIASSWMSALIVDPMVRAYGLWQNPQIADFIVRMGNFEKAASKTDADGQFGGVTRYPDYLMRADGTSDSRSDTDVQHAMDVGAVAAWATYFAELRGTPDASLRQLANDLYATYDLGVNFWTSSTGYRVIPPRRYTWEYKNSSAFSWALTGTDAPNQPGTLHFSGSSYSAVESQGTATITVTRSGGSSGSVTVHYATSNGTAIAGSDYTSASGTLIFGDGETSKTFTVPIINDTAVEPDETVELSLSSPTGGASLASPATATLTIVSDDVTNQPTTVTYQQGVNGYTGTTDADISTQYAQFTGGNGSTGVDGDQLGVYQTTGTDGYTIEGLIRFSDLGLPANATTHAIVTGATLTLNVDTWTANPTIRGYYLVAPWTTAPGTNLGWIHRGTGQDWATPGALGQGADIVAGKNFVLPGITGTGSQFITINLDPAVVQSWIDNPNAAQGILLVNESPGAIVRVNASENANAALRPKLSVTYTVASSTPQPGSLQFSTSGYTVNENAGTATITVNRSGGSSGSVSVQYATSNGTATAGSDYTTSSGTLIFADGQTTKTFTVPIINDTAVEGNETLNLKLTSPTGGATLGTQSTAVLTIQDDDFAQPGSLQFSASGYSVNENAGTATITVTRTGGSSGSVSVQYATTNGTATAGSDYTTSSGTLTFTDGQTSKTFTVPIANDTTVEGNETVNLTLSTPSGGATLGTQNTAVLTIQDDDVAQPGSLQFSTPGYTVNENAGTATITVTRTGGSTGSVSVQYATANGTATAGSDYTTTSGVLTFSDGQTTRTFTVPIINDTAVENPETVKLILSSPAGGATLGSPATATLTINSDDTNGQPVTVTFQQGINGYTGTADVDISTQYTEYTEGNGVTEFDGTQLGVYQTTGTDSYITESLIRFSNLGIPAGALVSGVKLTLSVDTWDANPTIRGYYLLAPWSGTPGTSATQVGWLHRGTGQNWVTPGALGQGSDVVAGKNFVLPGITASGTQSITINLDPAIVQSWVNNPNADQGILLVNESPGAIVRVNASENANATLRPKLSVTYTAGSTTPQPGSLQFSSSGYTVNENAGTATITVTRTGGSSGSVNVQYATSNGTATAGSDYTTSSGILTFADGQTSRTFTVPIINDATVEGNETVKLTLTSPTGGATLGTQNTAVLTIQDDDVAQPGSLQFSTSGYTVNENAGTATITVTRTGGSSGSVSVQYATTNGTATAGSDYTTTSGTLMFADGQTSKTFTVPIINDTTVEGSETVNLTLSTPSGGATLGTQNTAVLTIQDDDVAQPGSLQFSTSGYTVNENAGTATITVTRTGGSSGSVSVQYTTTNGTATAGSDYTTMSGTLTFPDGQTSRTFTVPIINDATVEGNETVNLTLSGPTGGATLGAQGTSVLTIIDNDSVPTGKFTNITDASGVAAIIAQKYQQTPDWWLSGEHLVDLDNDGDLDLFLSSHGGGSVVALNNGHGVFTRVTSGSFPDTEIHEMYDINGDGKVDLSATYQDGGSQWWINHSTPGVINFTPTNVTREGNTSRSQVMLDFNGDGKVDWLRSGPPGLVVDFGDGAGGFTAGSRTFTIPGTDSNDNASFLPGDFDGDGDIDLLVITGGNYDGTPGKTAYWRNNGNMTFTDVTAAAGIPADGTIAKGVGDFNQDGFTDFIALENKSMPPVIYVNNGHGVFTKKPGAISGVDAGSLDYSFWGTAIATDFDNDGVTDIIMNGKYFLKVLRGTGGGNFTYMNTAWGIRDTAASSVDDGLSFGDFDGDGDMDIIGYDETFPTRTLNIYRNDLAPKNWLNVRPVGLAGNVGAAGAKIIIYAAGTNQLLWYEQVASYDFQVATSYYGFGETERHFGLGARTSVDVTVTFADGRTTRVNNVAANQTIRVLESNASAPAKSAAAPKPTQTAATAASSSQVAITHTAPTAIPQAPAPVARRHVPGQPAAHAIVSGEPFRTHPKFDIRMPRSTRIPT